MPLTRPRPRVHVIGFDLVTEREMMTVENGTTAPAAPKPIRYAHLLALSVLVGAVGGLLAALYYAMMQGGIRLIWEWALPAMANHMPYAVALIGLMALGGLLVGLATRRMGRPGEISAVVDNIHMKHGQIDSRATPAMVVISLVSIVFGGSAGPEAPLVQIIGSLASRLGMRLSADHVRTLTFCGMSAALGAFFGAPLGGALFALEIPHRRGLEYYEALVPSILAALSAFWVFRGIVGYDGAIYHLSGAVTVDSKTMLYGLLLGALGAGIGSVFMLLFRGVGHITKRLESSPVWLALAGGIILAVIALLCPATTGTTSLFWGEHQIVEMISHSDSMTELMTRQAILPLLALAALKMFAITITLHCGYRGGFIFPLFFVGAACGLALSYGTHGAVSPAIAVLCLMAAVNVAVTKTPISTAVILSTLSGTAVLPVIAAACFTSFVLTTRMNLIKTQRERGHAGVEPSSCGQG